MTEPMRASVLSHFWSPLTAVGSHGPAGPNAQICVSVFGASIVPERPRLLVSLSKTNYTTDLIQASGTLAITLLSADQVELLVPLGLHSGRDGAKLEALAYERTEAGDPWFPGGVGLIDCGVLDTFDLGDALTFLCAVRSQRALAATPALTWAAAREVVGDDFLRRWAAKTQVEQRAAYSAMRW